MVACPDHILKSTKGIEVKLGTYKDVNVLVMSWCTSSVYLQVLPFIDNRHLGSIPRLQ